MKNLVNDYNQEKLMQAINLLIDTLQRLHFDLRDEKQKERRDRVRNTWREHREMMKIGEFEE